MQQHEKDTIMVPIDGIHETFFVRTKLDEDRVTYFMGLYGSGADVPPIKIVKDTFELIDGRHRKAAQERLDKDEVACVLKDAVSVTDLLMEALADNIGGPLPPTQDDIHYVIRQFLDAGVPRAQIIRRMSLLTSFPPVLVTRYVNDVQSMIAKTKLKKAAHAVIHEDLTVMEAATRYDVNPGSLKIELGKDIKPPEEYNWGQVMTAITRRYKSTSSANASLLSRLMKDYEAGVVERKEVYAVLKRIDTSIKQMTSSHENWVTRFEAFNPIVPTVKSRKTQKAAKPSESQEPDALEKMGLR